MPSSVTEYPSLKFMYHTQESHTTMKMEGTGTSWKKGRRRLRGSKEAERSLGAGEAARRSRRSEKSEGSRNKGSTDELEQTERNKVERKGCRNLKTGCYEWVQADELKEHIKEQQ